MSTTPDSKADDIEIVDSHHHLSPVGDNRFLIDQYVAQAADTNISATVYIESRVMLRADGPVNMRPVGETEFANGIAAMSASGQFGPARLCAAIVGHADLAIASAVGDVLDAHVAAGGGRFRGIRQVALWSDEENAMSMLNASSRARKGLLSDPAFRKGFGELRKRELSFDATVFHTQLGEVASLAAAFPDTRIVLDHMGFALAMDRTPEKRQEAFEFWKSEIAAVAERENVFVKIGGLGIPFWGFPYESIPADGRQEALVQLWRPYFETTLELFGAGRCMLESNFPPDGRALCFREIWETFRLLASSASPTERSRLFGRTARSFYRI